MIGLCLKCLYIFELRVRYQEYWDENGFSHRSYKECPKCRSTKLIVRKSFNLNDMKFIQKRIEEGDFESVMEPIRVVKPPKSKSRKRSRKPPGSKGKPGRPPTPHRPIIPEIKPRCWGEKWNYADKHCTNKCDVRKSCEKEFEYQKYKKGLLPDETSQ